MRRPSRTPGRLALQLVQLLVLSAILGAQPAPQWRPPMGIPAPRFGIENVAPAPPTPWTQPTAGFYYVDASARGATDRDNPLGSPGVPRATVPLELPPGAVVELHGTYDRAHYGRGGIVARGTAEKPVFIRGSDASAKPSIVQAWEVHGSYLVLENLRFRARDRTATGSVVILSPSTHVALRHSEISGNLTGGGMGVESWDGRTTSSDVVIWSNKVHDNGNIAADFDQDRHGIHIGERVSRVWVVDNEMWRNSGDGIQISARTAANQSSTHHIYVARNESHHNKQNGFWTKQAVDVIFSENVSYANRPSNSSSGVGLGFQYAPSFVWFLFNHVYDSDYGIGTGSDSDLGTGTESFFIGNLIHDIHDSDKDFKPLSAWHNCGISLPGGVNRYVVNNTLINVDSGVCSPDVTGKVELHNNIVFGIRPDGQHVFLEFGRLAVGSHSTGNVFGPAYRALTAGTQHESRRETRNHDGRNSVVRSLALILKPPMLFDLTPASAAVDVGVDDPSGVYALYQSRYGIDIRKDFLGRDRPSGPRYDAGAFELPSAGSPAGKHP